MRKGTFEHVEALQDALGKGVEREEKGIEEVQGQICNFYSAADTAKKYKIAFYSNNGFPNGPSVNNVSKADYVLFFDIDRYKNNKDKKPPWLLAKVEGEKTLRVLSAETIGKLTKQDLEAAIKLEAIQKKGSYFYSFNSNSTVYNSCWMETDCVAKILRQIISPDFGRETQAARQWDSDILKQQKQIILYGPPGTGKTFLARQLAARLLNRNDAERPETAAPADDSLPADGQGADEKSKKESLNIDKILDDAGKDNRFAMVQFHPGYSYSDFVEGIAPGKEGFAPTGRIFREVAEKAAENPQQPCVLIIDEINRARIADTFGELLYGLENRESPIDTALSHTLGKLSVPKNLYVIGTMNTADRTLAALDYALRRRFAFCPVPAPDPESSMIFNLIPKESEVLCLYRRIYEDVGLAAAKGVSPEDIRPGPGYFMNTMGSKLEGEALRAYLKFKLDYQLWPLLQEYVKNGLLRARVKVGGNRDHTIASEEYREELRALLQPGGGAK